METVMLVGAAAAAGVAGLVSYALGWAARGREVREIEDELANERQGLAGDGGDRKERKERKEGDGGDGASEQGEAIGTWGRGSDGDLFHLSAVEVPRGRRRWSDSEMARFYSMWLRGYSCERMALELGRSVASVRKRRWLVEKERKAPQAPQAANVE